MGKRGKSRRGGGGGPSPAQASSCSHQQQHRYQSGGRGRFVPGSQSCNSGNAFSTRHASAGSSQSMGRTPSSSSSCAASSGNEGESPGAVSRVGLINPHIQCFFNSTVQVLYHNSSFRSYVMQNEVDGEYQSATERNKILAHKQSRGQSGSKYAATPRAASRGREPEPVKVQQDLRSLFHSMTTSRGKAMRVDNTLLRKLFQGRNHHRLMQDAHEFFNRLMARSHDESCPKGDLRGEIEKHTSGPYKCFGGFVQQSVVCSCCKHASTRIDPMIELSLCFPVAQRSNFRGQMQSQVSVHDLLQNYFREDKLVGSNKYLCAKCKTRQNACKFQRIHQIPRNLVLHMKQYDEAGNKVNKKIQLPRKLDMAAYTTQGPKRDAVYRLTALVHHSGVSTNDGHYYAFVNEGRGENDSWHCFDDSNVSRSSYERATQFSFGGRRGGMITGPYMAFYELVSGRPIDLCKELLAKETKKAAAVLAGESQQQVGLAGPAAGKAAKADPSLNDEERAKATAEDPERRKKRQRALEGEPERSESEKKNKKAAAVKGLAAAPDATSSSCSSSVPPCLPSSANEGKKKDSSNSVAESTLGSGAAASTTSGRSAAVPVEKKITSTSNKLPSAGNDMVATSVPAIVANQKQEKQSEVFGGSVAASSAVHSSKLSQKVDHMEDATTPSTASGSPSSSAVDGLPGDVNLLTSEPEPTLQLSASAAAPSSVSLSMSVDVINAGKDKAEAKAVVVVDHASKTTCSGEQKLTLPLPASITSSGVAGTSDASDCAATSASGADVEQNVNVSAASCSSAPTAAAVDAPEVRKSGTKKKTKRKKKKNRGEAAQPVQGTTQATGTAEAPAPAPLTDASKISTSSNEPQIVADHVGEQSRAIISSAAHGRSRGATAAKKDEEPSGPRVIAAAAAAATATSPAIATSHEQASLKEVKKRNKKIKKSSHKANIKHLRDMLEADVKAKESSAAAEPATAVAAAKANVGTSSKQGTRTAVDMEDHASPSGAGAATAPTTDQMDVRVRPSEQLSADSSGGGGAAALRTRNQTGAGGAEDAAPASCEVDISKSKSSLTVAPVVKNKSATKTICKQLKCNSVAYRKNKARSVLTQFGLGGGSANFSGWVEEDDDTAARAASATVISTRSSSTSGKNKTVSEKYSSRTAQLLTQRAFRAVQEKLQPRILERDAHDLEYDKGKEKHKVRKVVHPEKNAAASRMNRMFDSAGQRKFREKSAGWGGEKDAAAGGSGHHSNPKGGRGGGGINRPQASTCSSSGTSSWRQRVR